MPLPSGPRQPGHSPARSVSGQVVKDTSNTKQVSHAREVSENQFVRRGNAESGSHLTCAEILTQAAKPQRRKGRAAQSSFEVDTPIFEMHPGCFRVGLKLGRRAVFPFHLAETNSTMPTKTIIKPANSPAAVGPDNHAVRVGDLLFCAGQIPLVATGNLVAGDIKVQTERVLQNVKAILDDQGLTFANVAKSTVFLTDLANFAGMNEVYAKYFTSDFRCARPSRWLRCRRAQMWRLKWWRTFETGARRSRRFGVEKQLDVEAG